MEAFDVYDHGRTVLMGTFTATALMTQPVDVAAYQGLFEQMAALADFDEAAVSTFQRLAQRYREIGRRARAAQLSGACAVSAAAGA